ncbi:LOW QUALITY PROTEIN: rab15 effector protein [Amazona ochrocephala]
MGQKVSQQDNQQNKAQLICEVFSQGVVHVSQRLKNYLDPQSKFQPATNTLSEVLVNFISFCLKKGVEERITTSTVTKQQSSLFRVNWIWTLSGADKQINLPCRLYSWLSFSVAEMVEDCCWEAALADEYFQNRSRFEELVEFCHLVGQYCLGLFIMFCMPGKPKDIRGVMLGSIAKEEQNYRLSGRDVLWQFVTGADSFLPTKGMLENCLGTKTGLKEVGSMYISFL